MIDDNYTFGTGPELPKGHDNRADYRLTARAVAAIQMEASEPMASPPSGMPGQRVLECRIRDISTGGFSLTARGAFAEGSILSSRVDLGNGKAPYQLTIEAVWCRPAEQGYLIGVRVLESDETDYLEWMDAVADALAEG